MTRRTEYDESQAAGRLRVPITVFRWARHTRLVPAPDAILTAFPREPIAGSVAADRIADALGTPNPTAYGER
ncbi:hypothetical protein QF026_008580 [Streptomyces aurantiacus]|uniref:hypothetical protein n=1 Tax=Streptomyces aurantiacus TaxID=47760 RepID=UPI00278F73A9|nr:hypothetical protein [Streptomyces aurantiacus]MDQ0780114.1 hypothetical protein [Streptomyces aurantiacus]